MASTSKREKRKRFVLTLRQKIDICKKLENGVNRNDVMREFNISSSTLYDIKSRKDELMKFCSESGSDKVIMERKALSKPKLEQLDSALYKWFQLKRSEGIIVTGPMLLEKAMDFYKHMNLNEKCTFSEGWLYCFKRRHGITKHSISDEQKSADNDESVKQYCESFSSLIKEHDLIAEQVYSASKAVLFWGSLPPFVSKCSDEFGAPGFNNRVTVLNCANAAGTHKLKLLVVGNYNSSLVAENIDKLPIVYKEQCNSWINNDIFYEWFHQNFVPEIKEHFKNVGLSEESKVVLLLDSSKGQLNESYLVSGNILANYLPPNVASLVQPMDQGIIQSMKYYYKKELLRKLVNHDSTVQDFQAKFNITDAVSGLAVAWKAVKKITLKKAWRNLWPENANEQRSECNEEEFAFSDNSCNSFFPDIGSTPSFNIIVNLKEVQTWLNEDLDDAVSDVEILDSVLNQSNKPMKEESSAVKKKISWSTAAHHLQEFIQFAETCPSYSAGEIVNLHILQTMFENKRKQFSK